MSKMFNDSNDNFQPILSTSAFVSIYAAISDYLDTRVICIFHGVFAENLNILGGCLLRHYQMLKKEEFLLHSF